MFNWEKMLELTGKENGYELFGRIIAFLLFCGLALYAGFAVLIWIVSLITK